MFLNQALMGGYKGEHPQTFRRTEAEEAKVQDFPPPLIYARGVGGSSVHFSGNYWRFRPSRFQGAQPVRHRSPGAALADWPITYEELEPYYTKVDWEIGVSGAPGPFDPPRSKPYPLPPMPVKSSGVLLERGAQQARPASAARADRDPVAAATTGAAPACTAASAWRSAARSARSPRRSRR